MLFLTLTDLQFNCNQQTDQIVFLRNRQILTQTLIPVLTHFFGILKKFNGIYLSSILLYNQP